MTNTQNATYSTLWRIGSDLDDTHSKLEYLLDLLQIYDEHFDDEMDFIKKQDGPVYRYIQERLSLMQSLLWVAREYLFSTADELQAQINAVYDEGRNEYRVAAFCGLLRNRRPRHSIFLTLSGVTPISCPQSARVISR